MQQGVKPTDTQVGKNQTQQDMQGAQTGGSKQSDKQVVLNGQTQQGNQQKQIGKTHQGDQLNHTSENQQDQYNTLCRKMKQKRQNFTRATEELNAAAKQLLTKRKQNKEQYNQHTDAQCRNAIPKMMNVEASTRQGVGSVAAYGKAGVGALSRGVTSLFKRKSDA